MEGPVHGFGHWGSPRGQIHEVERKEKDQTLRDWEFMARFQKSQRNHLIGHSQVSKTEGEDVGRNVGRDMGKGRRGDEDMGQRARQGSGEDRTAANAG